MEQQRTIRDNEKFICLLLRTGGEGDVRTTLARRDLKARFLYLSDKFYNLEKRKVLQAYNRAQAKVLADVRLNNISLMDTHLESLVVKYGKREMWLMKYEEKFGYSYQQPTDSVE